MLFQANIITAAKDKLSLVPLSTEIVKNRIDDFSEDILHQVVADLKASHTKFSLQLDETTDVANLSQLIAFVHYVTGDIIKEFLCKHLTTTAKAIDVKKILDDFFTNNNGLIWSMVSAVCTDGAHAMMGCNSGLRGLIKGDAPHITITHCMLHRHALMSKTLPSSLADVLKILVETVNYVKGRPLNHRIFMQLCELMDSEFKVLLYHSEVRWLSRGKVMNRVFVLRAELLEFLRDHNHRHAKHFNNPSFLLTLAYLADMFAAPNHLNCQMQGGGVTVIEAEEKICVFERKLELWWQQLENDNFANFPLLDEIASSSSTAMNDKEDHNELQRLKLEFVKHLQKLQLSFKNYFSDQRKYPEWIRQPFAFDTTTVDTNNT